MNTRQISTENVVAMRAMARETRAINSPYWATKLGVSKAIIGRIIRGLTYTDIPGALSDDELDAPKGGGKLQTLLTEEQIAQLMELRTRDITAWSYRALADYANEQWNTNYYSTGIQRMFRKRGFVEPFYKRVTTTVSTTRQPRPSKSPAINSDASRRLTQLYGAPEKKVQPMAITLPEDKPVRSRRPQLIYRQHGAGRGQRVIDISSAEGRQRLAARILWDRAQQPVTEDVEELDFA